MIDNCMPTSGKGGMDAVGGILKSLLGGTGLDGSDVVCTRDGKINITDKETLELARSLLNRVEKRLNEPAPPEPLLGEPGLTLAQTPIEKHIKKHK